MRLHNDEIAMLKSKLKTLSSEAKLYLFGSRTDDEARGGDIDLLVVSDRLTKKDLRVLRVEFYKHFGEQKLDIVLDNTELKSPFVRHILEKAILL